MRSAPMWVKALAVVGALSLVFGVVVLGVKGVGKLQGSDDRVTAPDGSTTGAPVVESPSSTSKNESEGANQSTGTVETGTSGNWHRGNRHCGNRHHAVGR